MKITTTTQVEVDLRTLSFAEWPDEAKAAARMVVSKRGKGIMEYLFPREELIAQVERKLERQEEFRRELTKGQLP